MSSVKAFNFSVTMSGYMLFSDNTATLTLQRDVNISFKNKHATNNGGVLYVVTAEMKGTKVLTLGAGR